MGLVHAVLYCAFAVVALWLLGELLLQRRAPVHWRGLAFGGFLVLVAGVVRGSLPLIGAGVVGFGAGQWLTTQAVKRGTGEHWALRAAERLPLAGRLFGAEAAPPPEPEPEPVVGEVSQVEEYVPEPAPDSLEQTQTWAPAQEEIADAYSAYAEPGGQAQAYDETAYAAAYGYDQQPYVADYGYTPGYAYEQQGVYAAAPAEAGAEQQPQVAYYWDGQQYVAYYPEYQPQAQTQSSGWADQSGGY
ncbi:hypothetical protein [Streptacidiphilus monticola]|uniref:Uncharacterized protein n=1 Tax=Streptacidiphilus monticola TaxID=2161674 RepID=A0ABW1FVD7_9ACTN